MVERPGKVDHHDVFDAAFLQPLDAADDLVGPADQRVALGKRVPLRIGQRLRGRPRVGDSPVGDNDNSSTCAMNFARRASAARRSSSFIAMCSARVSPTIDEW